MRKILFPLLFIIVFGCNSKTNKGVQKQENLPILRIAIVKNIIGEWFPNSITEIVENSLKYKPAFYYFEGINDLITSSEDFDVAIGINNPFLKEAIKSNKFNVYKSEETNSMKDLDFNNSHHFTPLFYDYVCILADTTQIKSVPRTLGNLQEDFCNNQLILCNPENFAYSRGFYIKTLARFTQSGHRQFWHSMQNKIREIAPSPSFAHRMVLAREAGLWIGGVSYSFYNPKLKPILLKDLGIREVFGMGIYKNSPNKEIAQKFIDLLLSERVQKIITSELNLYPVNKSVDNNPRLPKENFVDISRDGVSCEYVEYNAKRYLDINMDLFEKMKRRVSDE